VKEGEAMIFRRSIFAVAIFLLCIYPITSAEKQHEWLVGKLLDSESSRAFAGTVGNSNTNGNTQNGYYHGNTNGSQVAIYHHYETFVIEGDGYIYEVEERKRPSKAANLTVNGPVKYAVEKRKLYVLDDDGKQHEMEIIKKTLKTSEASAK
jgi:hypothetical protein